MSAMLQVSPNPPAYTASPGDRPPPPSYDTPVSDFMPPSQPPPYEAHLAIDEIQRNRMADVSLEEIVIQTDDQCLPGYSHSRSLLGMRLLMKSLIARPVSDSFCKTIYQFPWESVPAWYAPLDTLSPGFLQGIQECNEALRILSTRKKWVIGARLIVGLGLIALIWILILTVDVRYRPVLIGILFPIVFLSVFSVVRLTDWIIRYKSPIPKLRVELSGMGWTLQGFEESQKSIHVVPEIIVTRYVVPFPSERSVQS